MCIGTYEHAAIRCTSGRSRSGDRWPVGLNCAVRDRDMEERDVREEEREGTLWRRKEKECHEMQGWLKKIRLIAIAC